MSRKKNNRINNQEQEQEQQTKPTFFTNILGEQEELICSFRSCYHKFSLHGHRSHQTEFNCTCNHPTNASLGMVKKFD